MKDAFEVVCVVLVGLGALPVLAGIYQYALIPIHGVRNHLPKTAPYLPNVAVVVPAWNEGPVLGASLDRLMSLEYPPDRLRVFVVDDASTDDTPDVVLGKAGQYPGRIVHLRREKGGEGKAHTLNHGIRNILSDDWMEALLIMDADVIYRPDSLRRMTRHLADPEVGAVTAFIKEGSGRPSVLTRFIRYEYTTAQGCARRAQNVLGAIACLAGGAQLHSRHNLVSLGGAIDTSTLAEDTYMTFLTQLDGRRVVFEPAAVVLAEEPDSINALWKQRVRWGRGNVQITSRFKHLWFRRPWLLRPGGQRLGSWSFGFIWFSIYLLPMLMTLGSLGLLGLYFVDDLRAADAFRALWWVAGTAYLFVTLSTLMIDWRSARDTWVQAFAFPGLGSIVIMVAAWFPGFWEETVPGWFGLELDDSGRVAWTMLLYSWAVLSMALAWALKQVERLPKGYWASRIMLFVVGFGPLLCAMSIDSYVKEVRGAAAVWDKTVKTGRVVG